MRGMLARAVLVALAALGSAAAAPSPSPAAAASWSWPVTGVVSRPFAPPEHRWGAGHRGVDLLGLPGAPVRAAGTGRVSYAGLLAGRGVLVVVHGALRTTYEPVSASVGVGDVVAAGEVIGTLEAGHAGCPALACLHWGLRRGEEYLDPLRLVEPGPVRLLPVGGGPAAGSSAGVLREDRADGGSGDGGGGDGGGGDGGGGGTADLGRPEHGAAADGPTRSPTGRDGVDPAVDPAIAAAVALTAVAAGGALAGAALRRRT